MARYMTILSLILAVSLLGCSKDEKSDRQAREKVDQGRQDASEAVGQAAAAAEQEFKGLIEKIRQAIQGGNLDDAEKQLKPLEGRPDLSGDQQTQVKGLRTMLDAAKLKDLKPADLKPPDLKPEDLKLPKLPG